MIVNCKELEYIRGESYQLSRVSGNPRSTSPSQMYLICEYSGREYNVSIIRDFKDRIAAVRGGAKKVIFNQRRIDAIRANMPATLEIEENPNFPGPISDEISTRYRVMQQYINQWVNNVIHLFN